MKKIVVLLLTLCLMMSFASCAKVEPQPNPTTKEPDFLSYTPEKLYETALEKTGALKSSVYLTTATLNDGEELYQVRLTRVREGYDGFSYSREGLDKLYFTDKTVCVENRLGNFKAQATARFVQSYMQSYVYPLIDLPKEAVSNLAGNADSLSFVLTDEKILALYADAMPEEKGVFVPTGLTGTAKVHANGFFDFVQLNVEGQLQDGTMTTLVLETKLEKYRSEQIQIAIPAAEYTSLGDIRIPHLLSSAATALSEIFEGQATLLISQILGASDAQSSYSEQIGFYQNGAGDYYLSRQSLKNAPETLQEYRFLQILKQNGKYTENEYDLLTATLLGQSDQAPSQSPWQEVLQSVLLSMDATSETSITDDGKNLSVSFTLSSLGLKELTERARARFPESGLNSLSGSGSGVFTINSETGVLTAFSVSFLQSEGQAYSCQYSLTLDKTSGVELPSLQIPTPTTPGQAGEDHEH